MRINAEWLHRLKPTGPPEEGAEEPSALSKLAWFFGIALASVTIVATTAYLLRGLLFL